jgi:hypothetical protein
MKMYTEYWLEMNSRQDFWEPIDKATSHRQLVEKYKEKKKQDPKSSLRGLRVQWEILDLEGS